jgi:predicted Rossmann fold nucleotide-binding protein DprA/Smf involved in DNA uptake
VTSPADVLDCLGEAGQTLKVALDESAAEGAAGDASPAPTNLQGDAARIFNALTKDAVGIDALCSATGLAVASVQAHLMQLQLSGLVDRVPGNQVRRRR